MLVSNARNIGDNVVIIMPEQICDYASIFCDRNIKHGTISVTSNGFSAKIDPNLISFPYSLIIYLGNVVSKFLNTHLTPVSSSTNIINLQKALVEITSFTKLSLKLALLTNGSSTSSSFLISS